MKRLAILGGLLFYLCTWASRAVLIQYFYRCPEGSSQMVVFEDGVVEITDEGLQEASSQRTLRLPTSTLKSLRDHLEEVRLYPTICSESPFPQKKSEVNIEVFMNKKSRPLRCVKSVSEDLPEGEIIYNDSPSTRYFLRFLRDLRPRFWIDEEYFKGCSSYLRPWSQ